MKKPKVHKPTYCAQTGVRLSKHAQGRRQSQVGRHLIICPKAFNQEKAKIAEAQAQATAQAA